MRTVFGKRLKRLRRLNGFDQYCLAATLDVKQVTISCWELGKIRYPRPDKLIEIAKLFDCSTDYLLGLTNKQERSSTSYGR